MSLAGFGEGYDKLPVRHFAEPAYCRPSAEGVMSSSAEKKSNRTEGVRLRRRKNRKRSLYNSATFDEAAFADYLKVIAHVGGRYLTKPGARTSWKAIGGPMP